MKLKSEIYPYRDTMLCGLPDSPFSSDERVCLMHDAANSHALMMAMDELDGTYADCAPARDVRQFLRERSDELMAEWGFQ